MLGWRRELRLSAGINNRADFEKEDAVAVPTYVVNSLGDFAVLATEAK